MRELVGRLTRLDPEASESLKVISYFDRLIAGRVAASTLLRGASELSGATVGFRSASERLRVRPDGSHDRESVVPDAGYPSREVEPGGMVWLERTSTPHVNDAMVLERLALALSITAARDDSPTRSAVEMLLQPPARAQPVASERLAACGILGLDPHAVLRAVALPRSTELAVSVPQAVLATPWGVVRGTITADPQAWTGIIGIGLSASSESLPSSWQSALIALRLQDGGPDPAVADSFGNLLDLAQLTDSRPTPPGDVVVLDRVLEFGWTTAQLEALAAGRSLREIAAVGGVHHSTVQGRLPRLARTLGFDSRSPLGRTRLHTALIMRRLLRTRFD